MLYASGCLDKNILYSWSFLPVLSCSSISAYINQCLVEKVWTFGVLLYCPGNRIDFASSSPPFLSCSPVPFFRLTRFLGFFSDPINKEWASGKIEVKTLRRQSWLTLLHSARSRTIMEAKNGLEKKEEPLFSLLLFLASLSVIQYLSHCLTRWL